VVTWGREEVVELVAATQSQAGNWVHLAFVGLGALTRG
jgi:hypothetical protein